MQPAVKRKLESLEDNNVTIENKTVISNVDQGLIQYVQEAITSMKQENKICNSKTIFDYLKRNKKNDLIINLTMKDLIKQLVMAVQEGILLRKLGGNNSSNNNNNNAAKA